LDLIQIKFIVIQDLHFNIYFMRKLNMIKILSFILLFFIPGLVAQNNKGTHQSDKNADDYHLIWQDNFEGSKLDETNNWKVQQGGSGGGNKEMQYYNRKNIELGKEPESGENCLIISAKKENHLLKKFTSGKIYSRNKISFKYGKIEARIKLPKTANGLWPAFWLLGSDYPKAEWPKCGEIDIMEMGNNNGIISGMQDRYFNGACHWGEKFNHGKYPNFAKSSISPVCLQDGFHLYTLIWDQNALKMYVDLDKNPTIKPYFEMSISGAKVPNNAANYFHKQFFIIFNLAVGGNFTGILDVKDITALNEGEAKMYVDYVRVYQKGNIGEEFSAFNSTKNN